MSKIKKKGRGGERNQQIGQGMAEFALVLPILLLLTLGIIEAGRLFAIYTLTSSAAREATRYGAAVGSNASGMPYYLDCAGMRAAARRAATALVDLPDGAITISWDSGDQASPIAGVVCNDASTTNQNRIDDGDRLFVTVTATYQPLVPLVPLPALPITFKSTRTIIKTITSFPECNDGVDNDADGQVDYPGDTGCASAEDNTEAVPPVVCLILTTEANPSSGGTVNILTPNTAGCPSNGFAWGTVVTVSETPNLGYTFTGWGGDASGTDPTATVTMTANRNVTANFAYCFTLTTSISPSGAGTVAKSPTENCNAGTQYTYNQSVQLTASASAGYKFSNWSGNLTGASNPGVIVMNGNKSVTANFTPACTYDDFGVAGKTASFDITNGSTTIVTITSIEIAWPRATNGNLNTIKVGNDTIWSGSLSVSPSTISSGWSGSIVNRQWAAGATKTIKFTFANNSASAGYSITVHFDNDTGGCALGVSVSN